MLYLKLLLHSTSIFISSVFWTHLNQIQSCFEGHLSLYLNYVSYQLWLSVCLWGALFSLIFMNPYLLLYNMCQLWQTSMVLVWFFLSSERVCGVDSISGQQGFGSLNHPLGEVKVAFRFCGRNSGISGDIWTENIRMWQAWAEPTSGFCVAIKQKKRFLFFLSQSLLLEPFNVNILHLLVQCFPNVNHS